MSKGRSLAERPNRNKKAGSTRKGASGFLYFANRISRICEA